MFNFNNKNRIMYLLQGCDRRKEELNMEKNFKADLLKNIEVEIAELGKKVSKTREYKDNPSEYKNLIQAYREIVELYYKIKDDVKNIPEVKRVEEAIKDFNAITQLQKTRDFKKAEKNMEYWEVRKELTVDNHLFFINGVFQQAFINYNINNNKIIFDKDDMDWMEGAILRIAWLDENKPNTIESYLTQKALFEKAKSLKEKVLAEIDNEIQFHKQQISNDTTISNNSADKLSILIKKKKEIKIMPIEEFLKYDIGNLEILKNLDIIDEID